MRVEFAAIMETETISSAIASIRRHAKVLVGCPEQSTGVWATHVQAGQYVLHERLTDFVGAHSGGAVLLSFSADSTPLSAKTSIQ
eukprot:643030-Amphidinium_carterae.1